MTKTILVTGANRGIGLEFVKHYCSQGMRVFAVCREGSAALKATSAKLIEKIDVSNATCIRSLGEKLAKEKIDYLINNAGILRDEQLGDINYETIQQQFNTNTLGPLRICETLLPCLSTGAKIALITSRMGSIADNSSGGRYGYRLSKAALNAAGVSLAHDLKPRGISVALLHPGYVATDMVGGRGDITPAEAVQYLVKRIEELAPETSGSFWHANGETLPW